MHKLKFLLVNFNEKYSIIKLVRHMDKKVVLVTGSSKGIGSKIIEEFAINGYDVIINYNKSKIEAKQLKKYIEKKYKVVATIIKADITIEKEILYLYNKVINKYEKIDILVNNAALSLDSYIEEKTKEEFMKVLETNVVGPFLLTKIFRNNVDQIINISSMDATSTYNEVSIDYCASKAALNSLTQTTSLSLPKIKIISVMLPWVNTETIKQMDPTFLENELKRTNQKKLLEPTLVAQKIFQLSQNINIKTGSIIKWSDIND